MVCGLIALADKLRSMMERMVCKGEVGNLVRQRIAPERVGMGIDHKWTQGNLGSDRYILI